MDTTAIATRQPTGLKPWTPTFVLSVQEAVGQVDMKRAFMKHVMRVDEHYGTIPGTPKPSLWKPGAELLLSSMGLHCEVSVKESVRDYTGRDHSGESFIEFLCTATVFRQIGMTPDERMVVAQADGLCNSWETKYRWRNAQRECPDCHEPYIIKGKADWGGGWVCYKAKGGCGHKFQEEDQRIIGQAVGRIKNPDIADLANTVLKIAGKRGYVAAALLATGCSDIFTQDIVDEDDPGAGAEEDSSGSRPARPNGNGQGGGARASASGITDTQRDELNALNEKLGDRKWGPALLHGKAKGIGFEKTKAELEAQIGKANAAPGPGRAWNSETGELEESAPLADPEPGS